MSIVIDTLKIVVGKRWPLLVLVFATEIALILLVTNLPFFPGELTLYQQQYNSVGGMLNESAIGQVGSIFGNNLRVAMIEMIPGAGLAFFSFSIYETARIVQVISIEKGFSVAVALASLFFLPHTWLELPAYSIAVTEGSYLLYSLYYGVKHGWARFRRELRFLFVSMLLVAGVLIVAAIFEVTEIQLASSYGYVGQVLALLTWLPFLLILAGVVSFWQKARRDAPTVEAREEADSSASAQTPPSLGTGSEGGRS